MLESKELTQEKGVAVMFLLQSLGFTLNTEKGSSNCLKGWSS